MENKRITRYEASQKAIDTIKNNPYEARFILSDYFYNEHLKELNHNTVFEDTANNMWWFDLEKNTNLSGIPFGFLAVDFINQLISLKSKDSFIAYEKRIRNGAINEKNLTPVFDKNLRFYVWGVDSNIPYNVSDKLTDNQLEDFYNEVSWLWEYIGTDVNELEEILKIYYSLSSEQKENARNEIVKIYNYIRYIVMLVYMLLTDNDFIIRNSYNLSDDDIIDRFDNDTNKIKEYKQEHIQEQKDIINSLDYASKMTMTNIRYIGYTSFKDNTLCKQYDILNPWFLVPEDFMFLLLNQTNFTFKFCENCGCLYVSTNGNKKYCSACSDDRPKMLNKQRKENQARYLHKRIVDYINNNLGIDSADFRNESNYYWAIVNGKTAAKQKGYSNKIKTESDYIAWLEKYFKKIKK